ncbi:MAG: nucleotidyltransferase domain-containing protein [Candidatus Nanoarchaeia archaeon]|nr:nucleotidyltransferase domain-containing protein [Candidatus Nanoarchaeia archaeon]
MLHNKHFQIIEQLTGNYEQEIYGRELIGRISISQKGIALALKELEEQGILKSKKKGSMKFYSLNLNYPHIKEIISITETMKKIRFLSKNRKIAHIFKDDSRIVGIFGSYAKKTNNPESDIDIFIVGKKQKQDYNTKGRAFDLNISIKYFTQGEFKNLLIEKNNLLKEIVKNHILIFGIEEFINTVWRSYYGFN